MPSTGEILNSVFDSENNAISTLNLSETNARVTADVTNATTSNADVTGMSFEVGADETWSFEANLSTGSDSGSGLAFALAVPSGATHKTVAVGIASTGSAQTSSVITGIASTGNFNTVNSANGFVRLTGTVVNGSTAGTVQLRVKAGGAVTTATVFAGSYISARKVS